MNVSRVAALIVSRVPSVSQPSGFDAEDQLLVDRADVVARRVVVHVHLLEDHALLALELLGVELRVAEHVDEHVERGVALLARAADVVARVLLRGERVELAADLVDLHREVARSRAALRPLEEHVLREVGDAAVRRAPRSASRRRA